MDDIESGIYEWAKRVRRRECLTLNPDYDIVVQAIKGLAQNKRNTGYNIAAAGWLQEMRKKIRILSVHVSTGLLIYKKEVLANADFSLNNF